MAKNITEIAKQLNELKENIILIYAFNGTGKTRLSVEYKNFTKANNKGKHAGVYYNAFSEDLFVWDNDEDNGNENIKLDIIPSSLNQFHSLLSEDDVAEKLKFYQHKYKFEFLQNADPEKGIDSISFYDPDEEKVPIKISRGEERIFVWCFFLALFDLDAWSGAQDAHFYIDDPVSSMDEHNVFITCNSIFELIKTHYLKKRFIITTHHIGLFSILATRLKEVNSNSGYANLTSLFTLNKKNDELALLNPNKDVFLFHLHLLKTLEDAKITGLFAYHYVLLRQLLENISSFLGKRGFNYTLTQIGIPPTDVDNVANTINSHSHKNAYQLQVDAMSPTEQDLFIDLLEKINIKYQFKY